MGIAVWILSNWKSVGTFFVGIALVYFVWSYQSRGHDLREQTKRANILESQIIETSKIYEDQLHALERKATHVKENKNFIAETEKVITASQDAPIAGVLIDTYNILRARAAASSSSKKDTR